VKPHKISAFYLDKQKSFVPKKDSTPWLTPIGVNQGVKNFRNKTFLLVKIES